MAVLPDADRVAAWAEAMRLMSDGHEPCSLTKAELRAAIDAVDVWVDDNATAYNTAIPQPARGALTTQQKARLLLLIVRRRFEVS